MYEKIYVFFIPTCFIIASVGCIHDDLQANFFGIGRYKRQLPCGVDTFQCKSGECIQEHLLCNGKADCSDNSDETSHECDHIPCSKHLLFRCNYGACVAKSVQCNGVKDCLDGSDEGQCPGGLSTEAPTVNAETNLTRTTCLVPPNPAHGHYKLGSAHATSGEYVPMFSVLLLNCDRQFKPNPPTKGMHSVCLNGKWTWEPASCARSCTPIRSTVTTKATCQFKGQCLENCDDPIDGTVAKLQCERDYDDFGISRNPNRVCKDGFWDLPIYECTTPMCGVKRPLGVTNIPVRIKQSTSPWHVGVYRTDDKQQICGGSIISERVVLTAAHCFADREGKFYPTANFQIAAGKYYSSYDDPRDVDVQYSLVDRVHVPERYRGIAHYFEADLAVVVLSTPLRLSDSVQSVCVDWHNDFEYKHLVSENLGVVVDWRYSRDGHGKPTDELNEVQIVCKPYAECFKHVPTAFRQYLTHDKICAGHLFENTSICQFGNGGGLTFESNQGRHYIRGITSVAPTKTKGGIPTCGGSQYGTYTSIAKYIDFIKQILEQP